MTRCFTARGLLDVDLGIRLGYEYLARSVRGEIVPTNEYVLPLKPFFRFGPVVLVHEIAYPQRKHKWLVRRMPKSEPYVFPATADHG